MSASRANETIGSATGRQSGQFPNWHQSRKDETEFLGTIDKDPIADVLLAHTGIKRRNHEDVRVSSDGDNRSLPAALALSESTIEGNDPRSRRLPVDNVPARRYGFKGPRKRKRTRQCFAAILESTRVSQRANLGRSRSICPPDPAKERSEDRNQHIRPVHNRSLSGARRLDKLRADTKPSRITGNT
jgi:hypothetical protein